MLGAAAFSAASCATHFQTKNLPETRSSYLVKTRRDTVRANEITVNAAGVMADSSRFSLKEVRFIKTKASAYVVTANRKMPVVEYGRLSIVEGDPYVSTRYTPGFSSVPGSRGGMSSSVSVSYSMYKSATDELMVMNRRNLLYLVNDDEGATRKVKAARIYNRLAYFSLGAAVAGLSGGFLLQNTNPKLARSSGIAGLVALPVFLTTLSLNASKMKGAIRTYNK